MRRFIFFFILFVLVMTCPVVGQVKKQLTEDDYKLWSTLEQHQLSVKGNWVSYSLYYEGGLDTLFVENTKTLKSYFFAGSRGGVFAAERHFVVREKDRTLLVKNLISGKELRYSGISSYSIALGGTLLVMLKSDGVNTGTLSVVDLDGAPQSMLTDVSVYSINYDKSMLVCDSENTLRLLDLKSKNLIQVVDRSKRKYHTFAWQNNGLSFAWIAGDRLESVGHYNLAAKKVVSFDCTEFSNLPFGTAIYNCSISELLVSDDGKRIFFGVNGIEGLEPTDGVQVWNTADQVLYPNRVAFQNWVVRPQVAVWFPEQEKFRMVTSNAFPRALLLPQQRYALVYNPLENEPQFDSDAPINYYLQNIDTGEQQLLLSHHSVDVDKIGVSNLGNYVAYFKDNQWLVYDVLLGVHRNLTLKTGKKFTQEKYDRSGEVKVSGIAGWTANDTDLIVYDTYDLWRLKTDGSSSVRLTKGSEQGIVYRVVSQNEYGAIGSAANGVLDLDRGLVLQAIGEQKSGYFNWSLKGSFRAIIFDSNRNGWLKFSENSSYTYVREHYHLAQQLVFQNKIVKPKVLYKSNPQQDHYAWGFSRLITYENSKGEFLHGALFYPAGFYPDKTYPMLVHIYERQSDLYNQYVNPSLLNTDGFNISNYTTQGYFVLLPDIAYEEGQTGISAVDCVVSAVDEVLKNEVVDPKRVGLLGHSFGGYETNFIITQTNKFAAAISGAGVSDIVNSYVTLGRSNKRPDGWRYEYGQFRMGKSLFNSYQKYIDNSPISFASQIETPLLLWCGINDTAIDSSQSVAFHLALRRLQKPNIFLLYENGGHALMKREDQIDLTHRMKDWFEYYLNESRSPKWFNPDRI